MERLSPGFFASPKRIQNAFGVRLPLPGSDPGLAAAEFAKRLELADATWIRQPALEQLVPALAAAVELGKSNPAYLVDAGRREVFRRVLLAYALALKRSGAVQPSEDAMAEWIRTFPDLVITRARAGSDAEQLYTETRKTLATRGRGTLTVNLTDPSLQLYVDEVIRRAGAPIVDLLPGMYRVLVLDRYSKARRYTLEVLANQDSVLGIDWQVESALQVSPTFVAFEFPSAAELTQSGQAVARYAQTAIGAPGALLVKLSKDRGQPMLTAESYSPSHVVPVTSACVMIAGNPRVDNQRAVALAHYLVSRDPQPDVIVNSPPAEAVAPPPKIAKTNLDPRTTVVPVSPAQPSMPTLAPTPAPAPSTPSESAPEPSSSFLIPGVLIGGGLVLGGAGLYIGETSKSDGSRAAGYVAVLASVLPMTIGIAWLIDNLVGGPSIASIQRPGVMIGVAPHDNGGVITVVGRF
ncbi:MAG TPA: hypothetical protein VH165_20110 [Kofleriaceae bacterium]|nr:hypothetical protein [Kofleriaceae bacterium]